MDLLEKAREARKSPATLKLRLSQLRSQFQEFPILILEGVDDVGVYETWINRINSIEALKTLAGKGKEQLLGLRALLSTDETDLRSQVFFAVDRDFDELRGQLPGSDIFCTDRYSIENYLVDHNVATSVFRDEFRLDEYSEEFKSALQAYKEIFNDLIETLEVINFRIYCCRRLGVRLKKTIPEVNKFIKVHLKTIDSGDHLEKLDQLLGIEPTLSPEATEPLKKEFDALIPLERHRGKFFFEFFVLWMDKLGEEARNPSQQIFKFPLQIKFSSNSLTLRSLASRSNIPVGFSQFINTMVTSR